MGQQKPPSTHSTLAGCLEGGEERQKEERQKQKVLAPWGVWYGVGV